MAFFYHYLEAYYKDIRLSIRQGSDGVKVLGAAGVPHCEAAGRPAHLTSCQELVKAGWLVTGRGGVVDKPRNYNIIGK